MSATTRLPIALTIAGSDPSGGAGIQADLKTFMAHGVYGASVLTSLTAQNTQGVRGLHPVPVDFIKAQFEAVLDDLDVDVFKTGMLGEEAAVHAVADLLDAHPDIPAVVDPVMVATSGDLLLSPQAVAVITSRLLPRAAVVTPNLAEAATLLGEETAQGEKELLWQGARLVALGCRAVLLKGGHGNGPIAEDILFTADHTIRFEKPRIETRNTHGTGCTMASAIAARLACGDALEDAVRVSKDYVWNAIRSGVRFSVGNGNGPVDHMLTLENKKRSED